LPSEPAPSRGELLPDPQQDEIVAVAWAFQDNVGVNGEDSFSCQRGLIVSCHHNVQPDRLRDLPIDVALNELDLVNRVIDLVLDKDPDIIAGYEVQSASWGYLNVRAKSTFGLIRVVIDSC
jgi:DNA polymerase zeta